jgi:hypothetical protein
MVSLWKCSTILICSSFLGLVALAQPPVIKTSSPGETKSEVKNDPKSDRKSETKIDVKSDSKADIKFEIGKIQLGSKTLSVEIAETEAQQERGLMYRKKMGPDEGMLFIFKVEQILYFWMKNTFLNLSIGYFDKDGNLIDIQEMKAVTSVMEENLPNYPSRKPALYALEMNAGWFAKNKIKLGTKLKVLKDRQ